MRFEGHVRSGRSTDLKGLGGNRTEGEQAASGRWRGGRDGCRRVLAREEREEGGQGRKEKGERKVSVLVLCLEGDGVLEPGRACVCEGSDGGGGH